jgi:hypothetical protein
MYITDIRSKGRSKGSLMWKKDELLIFLMLSSISSQISLAGRSAVKALERTELLLPQIVQDGLNDRLHKFTSSLENPKFNCFFLKGNSQSKDISCSSHLNMDSSESQTA